MKKKFYLIQAKQQGQQKVAEIRIYDEIGFWGVTAKDFIQELNAVAVDAVKIVVSINSPGGNVFDANAIFNALLRHDLPVQTRVDGVAASAASLIFMAGDERMMPENAMLMIHNAQTGVYGTAEELRKSADMMDKLRNGIVSAYARSGLEETSIIEMMDETTWMTALDAQAMGFCTVIEEPVKIVASASAIEMLKKHTGTPTALLEMVEPEADPDQPPFENDDSTPTNEEERPTPVKEGDNSVTDANALVAHVFSACQKMGIPHLSEHVLVSGALSSKESIDARVKDAEIILSLCTAAKLQDKAGDFIKSGLGVEQVRARLFDAVIKAADSVDISNLQRDKSPTDSTSKRAELNPSAIYAARQSAVS